MEEHWNDDVVDHYEPGFICKLSDTEPRGEDEEATTAVTIFQGGLSNRNESRARVGLPPVEGDAGEAFFDDRSAEGVTGKEELKEGHKNLKHDNVEAIAAQQLSLELD
jgi:hypothetical protein